MKKLRFFDSLKFMLATVACIFAFTPAHAATLPAGYTELEYIESTGTQYIDTNITGSTNAIIDMQGTPRTDEVVVFMLAPINATAYPNGFGQYQSTMTGSFDIATRRVYNVSYTSNSMTVNGVNVSDRYIANNVNLALFGSTATNRRIRDAKLYSAKIYNNDTLLRNFIPARRDSDGALGMYDMVSGQFFTNAGTGTFIAGEYPIKIATTRYNEESFAPVKTDLSAAVNAVEYVVSNTMTQAQAIDQIANEKQTRPDEGCTAKYCLLVEDEDGTPHWYPIAGANGVAHNLPAGYTELQYIESTGTQYINTGITGGAGLSVDMVVQGTGDRGIIFSFDQDYGGSYVGDTGTYFMGPSIFTGVSSLVKTDITTYWESENSELKQTTTINGVTKTSSMYSRTPGVIWLFKGFNWGEANSFWAGKMFSFLLKRNGVAIRNFIPAKNSSGVVGMYDMVSRQFFTNAGTGVFVAGPEM